MNRREMLRCSFSSAVAVCLGAPVVQTATASFKGVEWVWNPNFPVLPWTTAQMAQIDELVEWTIAEQKPRWRHLKRMMK